MKGCENNGQFYSLSSVGGYKKMNTVFRVRFPLTNRKAAKKKEKSSYKSKSNGKDYLNPLCNLSIYL